MHKSEKEDHPKGGPPPFRVGTLENRMTSAGSGKLVNIAVSNRHPDGGLQAGGLQESQVCGSCNSHWYADEEKVAAGTGHGNNPRTRSPFAMPGTQCQERTGRCSDKQTSRLPTQRTPPTKP
jgi:hypothetical protein